MGIFKQLEDRRVYIGWIGVLGRHGPGERHGRCRFRQVGAQLEAQLVAVIHATRALEHLRHFQKHSC